MPLVLYRRHVKSCQVHRLKIRARAKRYYKECECPIWMYGRTDTIFVPRGSTKLTDWAAAEALRESMLAGAKDEKVHGPKLADCIEQYLASREHELGDKTYGQHKLLLSRLQSYCEARNAYFIRDLTVDLLERFKVEGLPDLADTSKSTSVAKLRCFLKEAFRRDWIKESLVEKVRPHRAVYEQKDPYTEEEVTKILDEALNLNGGKHGFAKHPKTFRLLLELMLETGMRVGDAVRYEPAAAIRGEHLWIYTYIPRKQKRTDRPKPVDTYIGDRLKKAIDEAEWLSPKRPFYYGSSKNPDYIANEAYARMQTIGARCEVKDCRPHRLRDTFAVRKLLSGFTLDDVSRLLGHSSVKITEAYYAKWDPRRKLRLEQRVAESLKNRSDATLRD